MWSLNLTFFSKENLTFCTFCALYFFACVVGLAWVAAFSNQNLNQNLAVWCHYHSTHHLFAIVINHGTVFQSADAVQWNASHSQSQSRAKPNVAHICPGTEPHSAWNFFAPFNFTLQWQCFSGSLPTCLTTYNLLPLEASLQNLFHCSWSSLCTHNLSLMPFRNISSTTTIMQMTPSYRKLPFSLISARFLEKLKTVLQIWKNGWQTNWNSVKRKPSSWLLGTAPTSVKWKKNHSGLVLMHFHSKH